MLQRINIWLSIALALSFFSCNRDIITGETEVAEIGLNIVDSVRINIEHEFVRIFYFNEHSFAGVNIGLDRVYLFNRSGSPVKIIDRSGSGPDEYKKIVKFGLGSSGDIVIVDDLKALFFPMDSENIKRCPLNISLSMPLPHHVEAFEDSKGNFLFSSSYMKHGPRQKIYFEDVHTITAISEECSTENIGGYPEESMYRDRIYMTAFEPIIYASPKEKFIYQVFPLEEKLYVLNPSGDLIKTLSLYPDQFGEIAYRKEKSPDNMVYLFQKNSRFRDITVGKKYILLQYLQGLDDDDISPSLASYNKTGKTKRRHFYSLYDKEGRKLCPDFANKDISALIGFDDQDYLWFQKVNDDESTVLYKAEIVI